MSLPLRRPLENVTSMDRALEDLLVRFIINVPSEDLSSVERELFHFEEASWFYTDFVRLMNPTLPGLKIKSFATNIIKLCPLVWKWDFKADEALQKFSKYKKSIPVRGAAIFNDKLNKILLVQGTESDSWSFPRGKISKDEDDVACCVREVKEEIGFDLTDYIDENQFIERNIQGKNYKIFLVSGVPEEFDFKPQVRNEIEKIEWRDFKKMAKTMYKSNVKYYLINSMMRPLSMWVRRQKPIKGDDQLKQYAEEQLKLLLGITKEEEQIDPGRELLNMLQTAVQKNGITEKPEAPSSMQQYHQQPMVFQPQPQQVGPPTQLMNAIPHTQQTNPIVAFQPFAPYPFVSGESALPFLHYQGSMVNSMQPNAMFTQNNIPQQAPNMEGVSTPNITTLSRPTLLQSENNEQPSNSKQLLKLLNRKSHNKSANPVQEGEEKQNVNVKADAAELLNILKHPHANKPEKPASVSYLPNEESYLQDEMGSPEHEDSYEEFESSTSEEEEEEEEELDEEERDFHEEVGKLKQLEAEEIPAAGTKEYGALHGSSLLQPSDVPHKDESSNSCKSDDGSVTAVDRKTELHETAKTKLPNTVKSKPKFKILKRGETLEDVIKPKEETQQKTQNNSLLDMLKTPSKASTKPIQLSVQKDNSHSYSSANELLNIVRNSGKGTESQPSERLNGIPYLRDMKATNTDMNASFSELTNNPTSTSNELLNILKNPSKNAAEHPANYDANVSGSTQLLNILHKR